MEFKVKKLKNRPKNLQNRCFQITTFLVVIANYTLNNSQCTLTCVEHFYQHPGNKQGVNNLLT